jgi:solute:Na+ symporter, SSS family
MVLVDYLIVVLYLSCIITIGLWIKNRAAQGIDSFLFASTISLVGLILGTIFTKPTDDKVVENFYRVTRPFGFWKKYKNRLPPQQKLELENEHRQDKRSLLMAIPWQLALFLFMMSFMLKVWLQTFILAIILILLSVGLYFSWYKKLSTAQLKNDK